MPWLPGNATFYANLTTQSPVAVEEDLTSDDAAWALNCAFLILTMQTGFAMLECGSVSTKNSASIMIKNCVDVTVGGLSYWAFGYGLTFGDDYVSPFFGWGKWFFTSDESSPKWGTEYSHYFFHFSFASTATTIVSGAVAERMRFQAYVIFAFYNTLIYCVPASWAWNGPGWLAQRGFFDFAGTCVVHYGGGASAFVAAYMVGPRLNRFDNPDAYLMSSPMTAISGMFMLWWAWMSFNAGSTFGVHGNLWKVSALAAVTTLNAGIAGGVVGIGLSMAMGQGKVLIGDCVNSILGGLVAITGVCPVITPTEALVVGGIGGLIACGTVPLVNKLKVDDPVGAVAVHFFAAIWGTLCVGLFAKDVTSSGLSQNGLFHGGGTALLWTQTIGLLSVTAWAVTTTFIGMFVLKKTVGIRCGLDEEILGADWCHHDIFSKEWCNDLYAYVIEKLKHGDVKEKTAIKIMAQFRKKLTPDVVDRINKSRMSVQSAHRPLVFSRNDSDPPTPIPEPSFGQEMSNRAALKEIMASRESPRPLSKTRKIGMMNTPLYRTFREDLEMKIVQRTYIRPSAAKKNSRRPVKEMTERFGIPNVEAPSERPRKMSALREKTVHDILKLE